MVVHFQNFPPSEPVSSVRIPAKGEDRAAAQRSLRSPYRLFFKRFLDVSLIILSLPVVLPVVALMALLAALDGSSPFYRQERVGKDGRIFNLLKIRTMVPHADAQLEAYLERNPTVKHEWEETQKLKQDPRITRFGRFLRKTSLDELPQLWNVLKGDMSIVGPRPMMVDQQSLYPGKAYYLLRPGITGPWQVSDRNHGTFAGRAKYDADYYVDLSLATDLSILLRTVAVVVRGTGY
ncbi:MAG: sugar transferase [Paracoccaceae bacterium]